MATAASLQVVVGADIAGALRGLNQVSRSVAASSRSFVSSAASTAVGFGAATIGLDALGGAADIVKSALGVGLANELEGLTARFEAMLGSSEAAGEMLAFVRKRADETPNGFTEIASAVASVIPLMKSTGAPMDEMLNTMLKLASYNPAQGLEGAAVALRNMASGQWTSLQDRFDIDTNPIKDLIAKGVPGLVALNQVLTKNGITMALVEKRAQTTEGRFSTFKDLLQGIAIEAGKPILAALGLELDRAGGLITSNLPALKAFWATLGTNIAGAIGSTGEALGTLLTTATNLSKVHGLGWLEALTTAGEIRIGELFGEDAAKRFHELVDGIKNLPKDIAEFKASIAAIPLEIAKITEAFKLLVITLSGIPVLGEAFKDNAAQFRKELGLPAFGAPAGNITNPTMPMTRGADGTLIANPDYTGNGRMPPVGGAFPQSIDQSVYVDMAGVNMQWDKPESVNEFFEEFARRHAAAQKKSANDAGEEAPGA